MNTKIIRFFASLIFIFLTLAQASGMSLILIQNMENEAQLPRNFRAAHYSFANDIVDSPSREGLDILRLSGSGQFSEKGLDAILSKFENPQNIYVLDLRQESHGFLNGTAVSWYGLKDWSNVGKSKSDIVQLENNLLKSALAQKSIDVGIVKTKDLEARTLPTVVSTTFQLTSAKTEEEVVQHKGLHDFRIPVTDHVRPTDENVDEFIKLVKHLPENAWLHIHCAAGMGRTTTFMALYDMMKNAKKVSFDDIIKRQYYIGGLNLNKVAKSQWKINLAEERYYFLKHFYQYCQANDDDFQTTWSLYFLLQKTKTSLDSLTTTP